jgi:hypothetical protein
VVAQTKARQRCATDFLVVAQHHPGLLAASKRNPFSVFSLFLIVVIDHLPERRYRPRP